MAPTTTRTYGPLHLEDLEPHRFEDLVRQLIYDFRLWRQLEATGRGGGDDGFDARGYEIVSSMADLARADDDDADDEVNTGPATPDRLWLVQCKRERAIGKTKLLRYLDGLADSAGPIDALLFVGACDFSKDARDAFRDKVRELGLSEAHLWGKGELEDQLFQPKNDHLLFAYFGISLQSRKRSVQTAVRARLATRKKAKKVLPSFGDVLIRDADDDRYPYLDEDKGQSRWERGRWKLFRIESCNHDGVHLVVHRHYAALDAEGRWDYVDYVDDGPVEFNDPWSGRDPWLAEEGEDVLLKSVAGGVWQDLPENEKAWVERCVVLPYENIVAIDEDGDEICRNPHVYVTVSPITNSPFRSGTTGELKTIESFSPRYGSGDPALRAKRFPTKEEALVIAKTPLGKNQSEVDEASAQPAEAQPADLRP